MKILNATCQVQSVMTDRGDLITIAPGEFSRMIVGTRNIMISAMRLGSPEEIGIIVAGSYELDILKTITGAAPYLYTDEREAMAKLLRADVDYKGSLNSKKNDFLESEEIKRLQEIISNKEIELKKVTKDLNEANDIIHSYSTTSDKRLTELEQNYKQVQDERDRLKSQLQESEDSVAILTDKKNLLQQQMADKTSENIELNKMVSNLSEQVEDLKKEKQHLEETLLNPEIQEYLEDENANLRTQLEEKTKEIESWDNCCKSKDEEIKNLTNSLRDATETIEDMKVQFNQACEQFRITKDENGNWIQLPEE